MSVRLVDVSKSYGATHVLSHLNLELEDGGIYCLMGPSGTGKTTLLRIILGLESMDDGMVEGLGQAECAAMFQEDRLCETLTPIENVLLVMPKRTSRRAVRAFLEEILPADCLDKPVMQLSGGMRRRVSLARAVAYSSKVVVLDEPFTGLDSDTRRVVIEFLLRHANGRTFLVSTHGEDDAALLGARKIMLAELQSWD